MPTRIGLTPPKRLPAEPCQHMPCTPEKLAALIQRAADGVELWHPLDAVEMFAVPKTTQPPIDTDSPDE